MGYLVKTESCITAKALNGRHKIQFPYVRDMESPTQVNATICAFFVFLQNLAKFFVEQGWDSISVNDGDRDG